MIPFSKVCQEVDYSKIPETNHVKKIVNLLSGTWVRFEHPHRAWEYGLTLHVLRHYFKDVNGKRLLDVGGGGSVFAPAAQWFGLDVLQVDPGNVGKHIEMQGKCLNMKLDHVQSNLITWDGPKQAFDAVVCLSVIEHVVKDKEFYQRLLQHVKPKGIFIMTTDFHPEEKAMVGGHLRTYNEASLRKLRDIAYSEGFDFYGGVDYSGYCQNVNSYSFASLALIKLD